MGRRPSGGGCERGRRICLSPKQIECLPLVEEHPIYSTCLFTHELFRQNTNNNRTQERTCSLQTPTVGKTRKAHRPHVLLFLYINSIALLRSSRIPLIRRHETKEATWHPVWQKLELILCGESMILLQQCGGGDFRSPERDRGFAVPVVGGTNQALGVWAQGSAMLTQTFRNHSSQGHRQQPSNDRPKLMLLLLMLRRRRLLVRPYRRRCSHESLCK